MHFNFENLENRQPGRRADEQSGVELEIRRPLDDEFLYLTTEVDTAWGFEVHGKHGLAGVQIRVEKFDRRGTEPIELSLLKFPQLRKEKREKLLELFAVQLSCTESIH